MKQKSSWRTHSQVSAVSALLRPYLGWDATGACEPSLIETNLKDHFFQDTSFTEIYVKLTIRWKSEGRIGQLYVCVRSVYLLFNQKWIRGILYRQLAVHVTCHILNHILPIEAFLHLMFSTEISSYRTTAVYRTLWDNISSVVRMCTTHHRYRPWIYSGAQAFITSNIKLTQMEDPCKCAPIFPK